MSILPPPMADLFTPHGDNTETVAYTSGMPLAARMRPETPDEVAGQRHLLAPEHLRFTNYDLRFTI